jgi:hypothetical protein
LKAHQSVSHSCFHYLKALQSTSQYFEGHCVDRSSTPGPCATNHWRDSPLCGGSYQEEGAGRSPAPFLDLPYGVTPSKIRGYKNGPSKIHGHKNTPWEIREHKTPPLKIQNDPMSHVD